MPDTIRDGKGQGFLVGVDKDNRLEVVSKSEALQHVLSKESQQAYQIIGLCDLVSGETNCLHIKNTSNDKNMIITYIRFQIIGSSGGTEYPNESNYFIVSLNRTHESGGEKVTPINCFEGSGNDADVEAYQGLQVLSGVAKVIDRWYPKSDGDMHAFNKEGAVIIGAGKSLGLSLIGDNTAGILYTRLSFLMEDI